MGHSYDDIAMKHGRFTNMDMFPVEVTLSSFLTMALLGSGKRKSNRIFRIKIMVEKLQRSFTLPSGASRYGLTEEVKKGHFSVVAMDNGNAKKFVVPLCYLSNPSFLRLLEHAAEEFGFEHEGALCIPCRWNELESILGVD
uniref:Small auxin up regulated protein n=1 Tax=Kalanchoe fedtschenkoi TaxID=63787 RepID=A0A7N0REI1_KALFE